MMYYIYIYETVVYRLENISTAICLIISQIFKIEDILICMEGKRKNLLTMQLMNESQKQKLK